MNMFSMFVCLFDMFDMTCPQSTTLLRLVLGLLGPSVTDVFEMIVQFAYTLFAGTFKKLNINVNEGSPMTTKLRMKTTYFEYAGSLLRDVGLSQ